MKINFRQKTRSGKWAVRFGIALVVSTALSLFFAAIIGGDPAVIENSSILTMGANALSIIFSLSSPLSVLFGLYTIIRHKDWSIWKPLVLLYALSLILFMLGEFLFPH